MRLSVDRLLRALFKRFWISGDLNLEIRHENFDDNKGIGYLGVSGVGVVESVSLRKFSVECEVVRRFSEVE